MCSVTGHESQVGALYFATRSPGIGAEHLACKLLVCGGVRAVDLADRPQVFQKSRITGRCFKGWLRGASMWFPFAGHAFQASANGPLKGRGAGCRPRLKLQYACPYVHLPKAPTTSHVPCKDIVAPTVLQY